MKQGNNLSNYTRRRALKALGSAAGVAAFSGITSAADPEVVRVIDVGTSGFDRVDEAKVTYYEDGATEHRLAGHQPHGASAGAFGIEMQNGSVPEHAEAKLVKRTPKGRPDFAGKSSGEQTGRSGTEDDIGTQDHSGSNDESDYYAYMKLVCEKGDRCGCGPEWEVYNAQEADWSNDDGDDCVSDSENTWWWKWAINGSACENWKHTHGNIWEDDGTCSLDQLREDRFSYEDDGGWNGLVMRQQLTLHADGSTSWEVTRYDDGGNGCLFHGVEFS